MTIEIVPTLSCPVGCSYCYWEETWAENPQLRKVDYDIDAMVRGWEQLNKERHTDEGVFHGGEPLLMNPADMDELVTKLKAKGLKHVGIQTSTYGMNEDFIKVFKKHGFSVGVSFDGPWYNGCPVCQTSLEPAQAGDNVLCPTCNTNVTVVEYDLNRGRAWLGNPQKQKEFARKTMAWIDRFHEEHISIGTITVLNSFNAKTPAKVDALAKWYLARPWLSVRFNPVHTEQPEIKFLEVDEDTLVNAYVRLCDYCLDNGTTWDPFRDYQNALLGLKISGCWHAECDATYTVASTFVKGDGNTNVCPKLSTFYNVPIQLAVNHKAEDWRIRLLQQTPFDQGGCKGCKYFMLCRGGCESDGLDGDIRNRTRFCKYLYVLFAHIEERMKKMFPALNVFTDMPYDIQEQNYRGLHHRTFNNQALFEGLLKTTNSSEDKSVLWPHQYRQRVKLEWRTEQ